MRQKIATHALDGTHCLYAAAYNVDGLYSYLGGFIDRLPPGLNSVPYGSSSLLSFLDETMPRLRDEARDSTEDAVELRMVLADLDRIRLQLQSSDELCAEIDARHDMDTALSSAGDRCRRVLESSGLELKDFGVYLCDSLPEPYQDRKFAVMAADRGDRDAHGIDPGLYFLRDYLRPFYSEFLLCHEIVHVLLGEIDPDLIARGLEEGIAEIVGAMYLSQQVLGVDVTRRVFILNRLNSEVEEFWEQYLDATRQSYAIMQAIGLDGLLGIVKGGRTAVKDAESQLHSAIQATPYRQEITESEADVERLAREVALTYPRFSLLPPLCRYVMQFVGVGDSVREIAVRAELDPDLALQALDELAARTNLVGLRSDRMTVIWSDCHRPEAQAYRYVPGRRIAS